MVYNKWLKTVALILIAALVFVGCDDGSRKGSGQLLIRDYRGTTPYQSAGTRLLSPINNGDGTFTDEDSFSVYNKIYNNLGTKVREITPTKLELPLSWCAVFGHFNSMSKGAWMIELFITDPNKRTADLATIVDIAQGFTVEISEAALQRAMRNPTSLIAYRFSFTSESGMNAKTSFSWIPSHGTNWNRFGAITGLTEKIDISTRFLDPSNYQGSGGEYAPVFLQIVATGNTKKITHEGFDFGNIVPQLGNSGYAYGAFTSVITPYKEIIFPSDFTIATFDVRWNLENIIEQYDNKTPTDFSDDIFILKNNFWDNLSVTIEFQ